MKSLLSHALAMGTAALAVSATTALTFASTGGTPTEAQGAPSAVQAYNAPHINAPRIFGVRSGSPFLFRLPVSGSRPLTVSAQGLPEGLSLDPKTGILTGTIVSKEKKTYTVAFTATNAAGTDRNTLRIVVGDKIALTPPMGWNSWYAFAHKVTEKDMRRAADLFEKLGLVNFGWSYINMDDGWQGFRGGSTKAIQANEKFPDIAGMVDHIHSKGLHAGLYTVPMVGSYAGFVGSSCDNAEGEYKGLPEDKRENPTQIYGLAPGIINFRVKRVGSHWFFDRDIAQMSDWGFDFIKFDWTIEPVTARRASKDIAAQKRDIVLSLSNSAKLADGKALAQCAQMWRTAGDIEDKWTSVIGIAKKQFRWAPHAGPGHWNDADMLQFGFIHDAFNQKTPARPSRLSFEEQRSQVSLWCLLAAPLLISCDLEKIDAQALSLITNPEVLEVDQDALGKPAAQVGKGGTLLVLRKEMEDGTLALGVFNTGNTAFSGKLSSQDLGIPAGATLRDLWARRDLPAGEAAFELPPHGCVLLRTRRACLGTKSWPKAKLPISPMADMTFLGKAVSDPNYFIWCTSPIQEPDGKVHLFCSRWPKTPTQMGPWYTHSEIVHYVGDRPEGPFRFVDVAIPANPAAKWNNSIHNPCIAKVGDTYVLVYITFDRISAPTGAKKMGICMATSKSLNGPWEKRGEAGEYAGRMIAPSPDPKHWTHSASRGFDNPTFLAYGGKFYLYFKTKPGNPSRYGYAVADKLEGPYTLCDQPCTDNTSYIEDATAFVWDGKVNLLTCDNYGAHTGIGEAGLLWQSDVPTRFTLADAKVGFLLPRNYWGKPIDARTMTHPKGSFKFERPGILLQNGKPAYFYAPPGDSPDGDETTSSYVFRINLPK